jgi:hypothetical protein
MRHQTIMCWPQFSLSTIFSLPIRRLAFNQHGIETLDLFSVEWGRQRGSLSSTLTHLELPSATCIGVYLEDLPALSHLCVGLNHHRDVNTFLTAVFPRRQFLQHLVARESFRLLVLRILPYTLTAEETIYPLNKYKAQLKRCSIPVQKVVCLETSVDALLGMCNYFMEVPDVWCEAEATMPG